VPWILLTVAGLLEVVWAAALPATSGFTRPLPTLVVLVALGASMFLLAKAAEEIPLGTAYSVWVGIGALGAVLAGLILYGEPASPARLAFLALLVIAIGGLRATTTH
jgi:quaternary ammonium compound-resistance protein SugE